MSGIESRKCANERQLLQMGEKREDRLERMFVGKLRSAAHEDMPGGRKRRRGPAIDLSFVSEQICSLSEIGATEANE